MPTRWARAIRNGAQAGSNFTYGAALTGLKVFEADGKVYKRKD